MDANKKNIFHTILYEANFPTHVLKMLRFYQFNKLVTYVVHLNQLFFNFKIDAVVLFSNKWFKCKLLFIISINPLIFCRFPHFFFFDKTHYYPKILRTYESILKKVSFAMIDSNFFLINFSKQLKMIIKSSLLLDKIN